MSKWAILHLSVHDGNVTIEASEKIDLEWAKQLAPKIRLEEDPSYAAWGCWRCEIRGAGFRLMTLAVEKHLGETGWEPGPQGWVKLVAE